MKLLNTMMVAMLLTGCSVMNTQDSLIGQWKSDEKKTLESMRNTDGVTDMAKNLFEHGVFGKVTMDFTDEGVRAIRTDGENDPRYVPYTLVDSTYRYYTVAIYDQALQKNVEHVLYKAGDCYYTLVTRWNFREYFCRVK